MAGSCSKANQKQSQKRKTKNKPNYNILVTRMKGIPVVCPACQCTRIVPSQDMYRVGGLVHCFTMDGPNDDQGNATKTLHKFRFDTSVKGFGPTRVKQGK